MSHPVESSEDKDLSSLESLEKFRDNHEKSLESQPLTDLEGNIVKIGFYGNFNGDKVYPTKSFVNEEKVDSTKSSQHTKRATASVSPDKKDINRKVNSFGRNFKSWSKIGIFILSILGGYLIYLICKNLFGAVKPVEILNSQLPVSANVPQSSLMEMSKKMAQSRDIIPNTVNDLNVR